MLRDEGFADDVAIRQTGPGVGEEAFKIEVFILAPLEEFAAGGWGRGRGREEDEEFGGEAGGQGCEEEGLEVGVAVVDREVDSVLVPVRHVGLTGGSLMLTPGPSTQFGGVRRRLSKLLAKFIPASSEMR